MSEEFIIWGWMDYGPNRDQVLSHFVDVAVASREEPGCLDYTVTADAANDGRLVVFERWASADELAAHFDTPHIAEFRQAIAGYPRVDRALHRYFVSRSEEFTTSAKPS
jgi:quinol monooxygenase YgiN